MISEHPHDRIGGTDGKPRPIPTEDGTVEAHRAIIHDQPLLLFHHAFPRHRQQPVSPAEMAGIRKTARRLVDMDRVYSSYAIQPLHWPRPEVVHFASLDDPSLYHWILSDNWLIQAETIRLHAFRDRTFLVYQRC